MREDVIQAKELLLARIEKIERISEDSSGSFSILKQPGREVLCGLLQTVRQWISRSGSEESQLEELQNGCKLIVESPHLFGFSTFMSRSVDQEIEGAGFFFNDLKAVRSAAEDLLNLLPQKEAGLEMAVN